MGGIFTDYRSYNLNIKEYIVHGLIYFTVISIISFLFYYSFIPVIISVPGVIIYYKYIRSYLKRRQDNVLTLEFKDFLTSVSSLLSTGHSLENAVMESRKELISIHGNCLMTRELDRMIGQLLIHIPIEDVFRDFSLRTDIDEIKTFAQILGIAKHCGGDLIHIIFSTSTSISGKVNVQLEINTSLSGKKFELYIMAVMPVLIMMYVSLTQPGFFIPMYHNITGIIIMTVCLCVYFLSIVIAHKILSVKDK